jgi:CBS domain-containing protein
MLNTLQVRDYMILDPFWLSPSMSVTDAIAVLLAQGLAGAPVVERGRLVGMFSESDGLKGALDAGYHQTGIGQVADYMSREVNRLDCNATVQEAAEMFLRHHRRCLPVVDGHRLVGQLSRCDILRAVSAKAERASLDDIIN